MYGYSGRWLESQNREMLGNAIILGQRNTMDFGMLSFWISVTRLTMSPLRKSEQVGECSSMNVF